MAEFRYIKGSAADFEGAPDWATLKTSFDGENFYFVEKHVHGGRLFSINEQTELKPITNIGGHFSSAKIIAQRERVEYDFPLAGEKDNVNHPSHYTQGGIECIDAIKAATVGKKPMEAVCVANVVKYLWRYEEKNGLEDVKKARWYLERLIKEMSNI